MCGRYALATPINDLQRRFGFVELPNLPPSYNVAPTQTVPVVRLPPDGDGRELALLRWGLVPPWSEGPSSPYNLTNARAETVAVKPAFRGAFRRRRCLVPADGFYEWRGLDGRKQPYLIRLRSGEPLAFAGLWERWTSHTGRDALESFTIIVTGANELVRPIHDRMPVVLAPEDHDRRLDPGVDGRALLRPCPAEWLEECPVSRRVNSPRNTDPDLLKPLSEAPASPRHGTDLPPPGSALDCSPSLDGAH